MLAGYIICQSCGCKGQAENTLSRPSSGTPVFPYHGHDPFEGVMHYTCARCRAALKVDPMDILSGPCVRGVPDHTKTTLAINPLFRIILQTGGLLQKVQPKIRKWQYYL